MSKRTEELRSNWEHILERANRACTTSGRSLEEISIIAVSKKKPASDVVSAYEAGCRIFGENYVQEASGKWEALSASGIHPEIHFIGALQRNKVRKAVSFCSMIQSVDSVALADEVEKEVGKRFPNDFRFPVLLQVNVSGESQKNGVPADALEDLCTHILSLHQVQVRGLMMIGSEDADEVIRAREFRELYALRDRLEKQLSYSMPCLSMGMSADFELAIKEGANMIRIGSVLFGAR
jgi:PLP dependent protein